MNKKFLDLLKDKTKDFGLSTKAIEDLAEQGGEGITDETTDEDLEKQADFMARIAKSMQGEVTRKMQSKQPKPNEGGKPQDKPADGADEVDVTNQILALASKDMKPDAGFMSVSTDATMNVFKHRRFQLQIEIPQGSPIYVTKNGGESECVLARAAKLKFKGVEYDSSRTICIVKCVLE